MFCAPTRWLSLESKETIIEKFGNINSQKQIFKNQKDILSSQNDEKKSILSKMDELEAPLNRMRKLAKKLENEEELLKQKNSRSDKLLGSIATDSLQGVYSSISDRESKLEALTDRYKRLLLEAESLSILKNLLEKEYRDALDSVSEPIKKT